VSEPVTARPAIRLNMIVRNEAHIVRETLDSAAPYIGSWVIVDTGSGDGTQGLVAKHMASLGIPGELHERPWRNFGHNRTEALTLAEGHGDYIWVIGADDLRVGPPGLNQLSVDIYSMRVGQCSYVYWRPLEFRDGLRVCLGLGFAGGRLSRCVGRPWRRGGDLGAVARPWPHPPHTRDDPGFGDRSCYPLVVDRAGAFADLRGPRTRASEVADHRLEFHSRWMEYRTALAAFQIDQDDERAGPNARL
jgi:glycosyltransferase involved in cell wall biosynthesis